MPSRILLTLLCLLALATMAFADRLEENPSMNEHSTALQQAASCYLEFINKLGRGEDFNPHTAAENHLAYNCRKVLNGETYTRSREAFVDDLLALYASEISWQITPADVIIAPADNVVVMRLIIEMPQRGLFTAIVILRFDDGLRITEINEVLNEIKGVYSFDDKASKAMQTSR